jgi:hypothetical protein
MTLGQTREIMIGVLEGKKAKDAQCRSMNVPTLTLEAYLFEFLERRYNSEGPDDIKEWFSALSRAINKFGVLDSDICVFGKMLRNMLAESFPNQQRVLLSTAERMVKEQVSTTVWSQRNYFGVPLEVFDKVATHMFNSKDSAEICKRLRDPVPRTGKRGRANLEALSRQHLRYQQGIEVLLTFNMNLQDDFLSEFIQNFRKSDAGRDGMLNYNELSDLVSRFGTVEGVVEGASAYMSLQDAKASTLRNIRLHCTARKLTFSETVDQFMDLCSARWTTTGKRGTRYQYHDALKNSLAQRNKEKQPEACDGENKLDAALKKMCSSSKACQVEPEKETKSILKKS